MNILLALTSNESNLFAAASLLFSGVAIVVSFMSLRLAWLRFSRSNRPFVTPAVVIHAAGSLATTFNIELANSGSQPALDVCLHTDIEALRLLMREGSEPALLEAIENCFSDASTVPVLPPGVVSAAGFGKTGPVGAVDGSTWNYGTKVSLEVSYRDLYGRRYREPYTVVIKSLTEFAGHIWKSNRRQLGSLSELQERQRA